MTKALIFGAAGQDGQYLARSCAQRGIQAVGCARSGGPWLMGDVAEFSAVERLVLDHRPDLIFHLAARSTTRHEALWDNHAAIATGTVNVLEAARLHVPQARVFLVGSGVQFRNRGEPISESDPFEASSPYAAARIYSVYAGRYYRSLGHRVYVGYLFHHDSPLRKPDHVSKLVADFARRIAAGADESLELGDIAVEKEWTFAGDVAEAMLTLVGQDRVFEAVIGSGEPHSIKEWLDECFGVHGLDWRARVRMRKAFVPEYRRLVSDPATMFSLGWRPRVGFRELARMMAQSPPGAAS